MKRLILGWVSMLVAAAVPAQQPANVRDVFKQMPDSLMPYLSANDRLDFLDFLDSGMKAEVRNQLGGTSEMTGLAADSLSIRMSDALRVDMLLLTLDEPMDSVGQVVVLSETFLTDSIYGESVIRYYTPDWQPITKDVPWNAMQRKRIDGLNLQNILKWKENKMKKG